MADEFPLTVFYDASCPVCAFEMDALHARDAHGRLQMIDISAPDFDAAAHGFAHADLDAVIHAVRRDGTVVRGMDVLRLAYQGAGVGAWLRFTRWPGLAWIFDRTYRSFARHRHAISRALAPALRAWTRAARRRDGGRT